MARHPDDGDTVAPEIQHTTRPATIAGSTRNGFKLTSRSPVGLLCFRARLIRPELARHNSFSHEGLSDEATEVNDEAKARSSLEDQAPSHP